MTALVFVDTNVLAYARDPRDLAKKTASTDWLKLLWREERGRTSIQVLNEYYDVVTRKFRPSVRRDDAWEDVQLYLASWNPQPIDADVLAAAHEIENRHGLSWWDCLVVAAAQNQHCVLLLSEDLQDGADYGGVVVRSPFTLRISEEAGAYTLPPRLASRHRGRGRPRRSSAHAAGPSS
jgi:predicted nucleic acid-binding protein